jgi:outer membrane protein OmpA-like peptidoglycan-associated protein
VASAQPVTGLYIGGGAGINITQGENLNRVGVPALLGLGTGTILATGSSKINGSTGFAGVVSLGWGFGNGLRAEVEGNYRNNRMNGVNANNTALFGTVAANVNAATTEQKYGGMVNVLYDFNGVWPWVVPYIGAGVGYQEINEKWNFYNTRTFTTGATPGIPAATFLPGSVTSNGHSGEGSFAYQAILGAAFPLHIVPGLAATLEYRFLGTSGNRSYTGVATAVPVAPVAARQGPSGITLGPSYNHSILVGLRYNFGVAPPPPPPPAQPPVAQPARSYLVFFDWDKATLTDRARQIIREAADNSTHVQYTRIEVNGYTDTSGTPQYNMGLSVRRAKAVQAELIKDGVPANAITIQGFGDTHLLVPTGPGVREPQNRRVEIILR